MPTVTDTARAAAVPLAVDLDGTFINTDMLWESLKDVSRRQPWNILLYPYWLARGRPCLKRELATRATLNLANLPFHMAFHNFLHAEKARGRKLILATASDATVAQQVVDEAGLFSGFVASDGRRNLRGETKAALLTERYGLKGFDYAGNSAVDLPVWAAARYAIVVNGPPLLIKQVQAVAEISRVFPPEPDNPSRAPW